VVLISRIKPKPGAGGEVEAAIGAFYLRLRAAEPGCLINVMHRAAAPPAPSGTASTGAFAASDADRESLVFYEVYRDAQAARAHTSTPHFHALMAQIAPLIDGQIELEFLQEIASAT
jgi:quinol monooxygenase YgiN